MGVDELATIPGEIPEVANLERWDKTPPQESMLQKFGNPSAVLHISLAPRHLFDVGGIDQQDGEIPFEQIENGLPVHPRTLYGDHRTPLGLEPGTHGQDVTGHGAKGAHLFLALPLAVAGHQAHFDVLLMDIHPSTDLMQHVHTDSPSVSTCDLARNARAAQGDRILNCSGEHRQQVVFIKTTEKSF